MMNSQTYLDSNILVYAFCEQSDNEKKNNRSIELLTQLITDKQLCLSNLSICEFAFIMKRLKEDDEKIIRSIDLLLNFTKEANNLLTTRLKEIVISLRLFSNSFDCYHLAFAEVMNCKQLLTYDNDFNKMIKVSKIKIEVLKD